MKDQCEQEIPQSIPGNNKKLVWSAFIVIITSFLLIQEKRLSPPTFTGESGLPQHDLFRN
jgi:hypothetical protein